MASYEHFFAGKRITMLGLGLLGRAVGDAEFLAKQGARLVVTDVKSEAELLPSVERLKPYENVTFHLGGHWKEDFTDTDMVIKAAGVRLDSPEVAAARAAGVPVYMSTALFAKFASEAGVTVVGVTGTRGKSTVAHMIHHALMQAGKRAHLGGNVRGISTLAMLPDMREGDIAVLELDSWQLQGFGDLEISPHVAVFTNLMPDHQNYYPDMETYFNDKANIFQYQKAGDTLIAPPELAERISAAGHAEDAYRKDVHAPVPAEWGLQIAGEHNRLNAALAAAALEVLGLSEEEIRNSVASFESPEGRLQFVREVDGVKIYNDNNATTPEATIAALRALDTGKKNIVLIMGGADKGLDMSPLLEEILKTCKDAVFLAGTGTDHVRPEAPQVPVFGSVEEALNAAREAAAPGDVILFSPAFASFGLFKNEYDRNDQFLAAVKSL